VGVACGAFGRSALAAFTARKEPAAKSAA
jgi:hypothetical protein